MSFEAFQNIGAALDQMNDPTDEQAALIKLTMEERRLHAPQSWEQQTLINLYKAKQNPQMLKFKIGDFVVKKQDAVIPENEPGAAG
ncbi:MAG: hypothetical protein V7K72_23710, partial [Nostoc sp.]